MQFTTNSDYPPVGTEVRRKREFSAPDFDSCDNFTTNVLRLDGQVFLAEQVIVPRPQYISPPSSSRTKKARGNDKGYDSDDSDSDSDSDFSDAPRKESNHAYWIHRVIKGAIYGSVWSGVILRRCRSNTITPDGVVVAWEETDQRCAVKIYNRVKIEDRRGCAENPYQELGAMQCLSRYQQHHAQQMQVAEEDDILTSTLDRMHEANVMLPLGIYYDSINLYQAMPYIDTELFDVLDNRRSFSEEEARYLMYQILNGLETLQKAGICHRDMSLENVMINKEGKSLVIDMGMCIKIPYVDDELEEHLRDKNMFEDHRQRQRCLIRPDCVCGKPYYMSPEIYRNRQPFDGYAVDMWAMGPLLFLLVTGFPPWEIAENSDDRFHFFTNGYFEQTVRNWNLNLSADLIDLLQRMFFIQPMDRLSLEQVRAHPWMQGEVVVVQLPDL